MIPRTQPIVDLISLVPYISSAVKDVQETTYPNIACLSGISRSVCETALCRSFTAFSNCVIKQHLHSRVRKPLSGDVFMCVGEALPVGSWQGAGATTPQILTNMLLTKAVQCWKF